MQVGDYAVKPSSSSAEDDLIDFLRFNNFTHLSSFEDDGTKAQKAMVVNVVNKTYFRIDEHSISCEKISERQFLDKINYRQDEKIEYAVLYDDDSLAYEGLTLRGKPYGLGVAYYPNGNVYRDGVFDIKGIIEGREYYPSGQLKFAGIWAKNSGYGPNYPKIGRYYSQDGDLIFCGKFEVKKGGVGYPMMRYPKYRFEEKDSPKIEYIRNP